MKYKVKSFSDKNIKFSEEVDSLVFLLNKKFSSLNKLTLEYFDDETHLPFKAIEDAFISNSNTSSLIEKNETFIEEYLKEIKSIREKSFITRELTSEEIESKDYKKMKRVLWVVENTLKNYKNLSVSSDKNEILSLISQINKGEEDGELRKKQVILVKEKLAKLERLTKSKDYLRFESTKQDLELLNELITQLNSKEKGVHRLLNWWTITLSSIILIILGTGIALLV